MCVFLCVCIYIYTHIHTHPGYFNYDLCENIFLSFAPEYALNTITCKKKKHDIRLDHFIFTTLKHFSECVALLLDKFLKKPQRFVGGACKVEQQVEFPPESLPEQDVVF